MAAAAVAPFFLVSFAALCLLLAFRVAGLNAALITAAGIKLALAFPILWRFFKVEVKLAAVYTILLIVASYFSPIFVRAFLQLAEGKPGPILSLAAAAALPFVFWVATRRIEDHKSRMFTRCVLLAALIAPTLLIGHGGFIILPAGMIWSSLFQGGVDMATLLISLVISMCVTTTLLVFAFRAIARIQAEK